MNATLAETSKSTKATKPVIDMLSTVRGHIALPSSLVATVTPMAREFFNESEAIDFSDEAVDSFSVKGADGLGLSWVPHAELAAMGLKVSEHGISNLSFTMTFGIDMHKDNIYGPTLFWVLLNDGLEFRQGKARYINKEGEWFVFTDSLSHGVLTPKTAPDDAMYVGWSIPLEVL